MYSRSSEPVSFSRDCAAVLVPQGERVTLPAGSVGYITQALGGSFTVQLRNAPSLVLALLAFGFSDATWMGAPLPLELSLIGAHPDCELASSPDVLETRLTGFSGGTDFLIQVPPDPALDGVTVFGAWVVLDGGAPNNPAFLVSTDSLSVTMGS